MRSCVHSHATIVFLIALTSGWADEDHEYTNDFAVEIEGDMTIADLVAGTHNLRVVRRVCFRFLFLLLTNLEC